MVSDTAIPKVTETDISRDDLDQAAQELEIEDYESLGDQELFEEVGRQLGEIDDPDRPGTGGARHDEASSEEARPGGSKGDGSSVQGDPEAVREGLPAKLQDMTREELRDELRDLGLPVSGNKSDLAQRLEAVRVGQASAGSNGQAASAMRGGDTEPAEDRRQARDRGEYRVETDQRDEVKPILDLELGPLALDILGLDLHLNRVHAVLVANPGPKHALLGKLLSGVAVAADKAGLGSVTDTVTDGVESVVDALPTPDTGGDDEGADGDGRGIVRRLGSAATGTARSALNVVRHGKDAAVNAKDAAKDTITSGGKLSAAKEAKDAAGDVKDAATSAGNAATGGA